jgi:hypothetical protein
MARFLSTFTDLAPARYTTLENSFIWTQTEGVDPIEIHCSDDIIIPMQSPGNLWMDTENGIIFPSRYHSTADERYCHHQQRFAPVKLATSRTTKYIFCNPALVAILRGTWPATLREIYNKGKLIVGQHIREVVAPQAPLSAILIRLLFDMTIPDSCR